MADLTDKRVSLAFKEAVAAQRLDGGRLSDEHFEKVIATLVGLGMNEHEARQQLGVELGETDGDLRP